MRISCVAEETPLERPDAVSLMFDWGAFSGLAGEVNKFFVELSPQGCLGVLARIISNRSKGLVMLLKSMQDTSGVSCGAVLFPLHSGLSCCILARSSGSEVRSSSAHPSLINSRGGSPTVSFWLSELS